MIEPITAHNMPYDPWEDWNKERQDYAERDTVGFLKDLEALKNHILNLQEVVPKDKTGFPLGKARDYLVRLQRDYARFVAFAESTITVLPPAPP